MSKPRSKEPSIVVENFLESNPEFYAVYQELAPTINEMIQNRGGDMNAKANVFLGLCAVVAELSSMTNTPAETAKVYIETFIPLFDSLAGKPSSPEFEQFRANLDKDTSRGMN